jgi:ubiquinone/menaquinone biosynthesis C-methylase UbiE
MPDSSLSEEALRDPKRFYDARYVAGYMQDFSDVFEACRVHTVRCLLRDIKRSYPTPTAILDYGCGEGRYIGVLREYWPDAPIIGCDISEVGLQIAAQRYAGAQFVVMEDETVTLPDASVDLVTCIEVIEHVQSAARAAKEMARVLRPGGILLLTTPCANRYSLEWFINKLGGGLEPTPDGNGRFATDEPGHLRRLTDLQLKRLFHEHSVRMESILHRAHLFTRLVWRYERLLRFVPKRVRVQIALLDWRMFKHLSNGATMIAVGNKI